MFQDNETDFNNESLLRHFTYIFYLQHQELSADNSNRDKMVYLLQWVKFELPNCLLTKQFRLWLKEHLIMQSYLLNRLLIGPSMQLLS